MLTSLEASCRGRRSQRTGATRGSLEFLLVVERRLGQPRSSHFSVSSWCILRTTKRHLALPTQKRQNQLRRFLDPGSDPRELNPDQRNGITSC